MGCGDDASATRIQRKQLVFQSEDGSERRRNGQIDRVFMRHSVSYAAVRQLSLVFEVME